MEQNKNFTSPSSTTENLFQNPTLWFLSVSSMERTTPPPVVTADASTNLNPSPNSSPPPPAMDQQAAAISNPNPKPQPKRFVKSPFVLPSSPALDAAMSLLPKNYSFEIPKTLHRISSLTARRVVLQLPDGLLMFSLPIADILSSFSPSKPYVSVLAEPTYGACCVDDFAAESLAADLLVHYGHSCLVPVSASKIPTLYIFVEIKIDPERILSSVLSNFPKSDPIAVAGTIQFISAVHSMKSKLLLAGYDVIVPQAKPLSAGEVLGCTAPSIPKSRGVKVAIFVADGRFHLEAFMIANPGVRTFRFDPFLGALVLEEYDHEEMKRVRKDMIFRAREARSWGVILGTLGRQGSTRVLDRIVDKMEERGMEYTVVMMSEISPARIELFGDSVDAWVQIACPRLSIDWGEGFQKPLLTTFEFEVAMGDVPGWWERRERRRGKVVCERSCSGSGDCGSCGCGGGDVVEEEANYPMDYYAQDGGEWNSSYVKKKPTAITRSIGSARVA